MKHDGTMFTTFLFLTVSNGVQGVTVHNIQSGNLIGLMGIHGDLEPQGYTMNPMINYTTDGNVGNAWLWARPSWASGLRQASTQILDTMITGTTLGTTKEDYYVPYWPKGDWVFNRPQVHRGYCPLIVEKYGPVCGRKHHVYWTWPARYKSFKNMCYLEDENWRGQSRYYPVHLRHCRNIGGWSHMNTDQNVIVKRKREFEKKVWARTPRMKPTTANHGK